MKCGNTCTACKVLLSSRDVPRRCDSCQRSTVGDDTYVNYSCPEQPTRKFNQSDVHYLSKWLDERIRVLEGMRGLEFGRNYLHANESADLNRYKLLRGMVKNLQMSPLAMTRQQKKPRKK